MTYELITTILTVYFCLVGMFTIHVIGSSIARWHTNYVRVRKALDEIREGR